MKIAAAKVIKSKTVSGEQPIGHTFPFLRYSDYNYRYKSNKTNITAYPVLLAVTMTINVILPQWTEVGAATVEDKEKWKKLFDDLNKHEQVHVCIALTAFNQLKQEFLGINGNGKNQSLAEKDLDGKITKVLSV